MVTKMRHPWRLLLFRSYPRSLLRVPTVSQVLPPCVPPRLTPSFHNVPSRSHFTSPFNTLKGLSILNHNNTPINQYSFSSEAAVEQKDLDNVLVTTVTDIFTRFSDKDNIKRELELNGVAFSHVMILKVLKNVEASPDVAMSFFNWVLETDAERLSSKSYNRMLGILGVNGLTEEFWGLVDVMKKKGYGISGAVRDRVVLKFEKEGLEGDLERLRGVFASGSTDNSIEKVCSRVSKIIKNELWGDDVEKHLLDLNVTFSNDLVKRVLENLASESAKALIFFRWTEESAFVKHDEQSYNALARTLGRDDCIDRFCKVVDEMRNFGYEMEMETYTKVFDHFCKRKMIKEAVDLYESAVAGSNKPSVSCTTFLLKKLVVSKQLDMRLFIRVIRTFMESGNALTDSIADSVLKSLTSVGRLGECNKVLKVMEEHGFVAGGNLQSKITFRLASAGKKDEAAEFIQCVEASNTDLDHKAWVSLIKGCCAAGDLETASTYFETMVEKEGISHAGYAFEWLVYSYCSRKKAMDACKLLHKYVSENQLRPQHDTYKELIRKLLAQVGFKDALSLLGLMKNDGFPPFVDPFIEYVSKSGSSDDAIALLKSMTLKKFPSISVVLRVFEGFFKAARPNEAQDLLSKCPSYVRNNADVLNLFCSMKSGQVVATPAVVA
ncbi:Pentatricopeptide repeat-containing protein [Hibiscus syriacus]|uniref:Pentatricopeptide repeat-containing protein n=1 Tax=Hibiscus syriacus TaxID=106335 RepID=A0A6A2ZGX9_HIBSY|nr:pentatricopeptide repeat-containing protein At5g15980, mitochondrial-like [Hibiscus syriacus]KAE8691234.1 Pentatricopeptide repeat-containing protein [Hibiscus syriacus]